jgi:hypothetical protein
MDQTLNISTGVMGPGLRPDDEENHPALKETPHQPPRLPPS